MKLTKIAPFGLDVSGCESFSRPVSFLQTPFWAEFKASHGWRTLYFIVNPEGLCGLTEAFSLTVLVRPLARVSAIAYVPLGPNVSLTDPAMQTEFLSGLSRSLSSFLPKATLCVRFDPPWGTVTVNHVATDESEESAEKVAENFPDPLPRPIRQAPAHIQPPDTVILDLSESEDRLLAEMKSKWRYNIRLGEKKGVTIRCLTGEAGATEGIDAFYRLYLETAKRDGIAIHSQEYYRDLVRRAEKCAMTPLDRPVSVRVYLAEHEGTPLASIITIFSGEEAVYLYGASSNEKRNLMPAYSLQWRAIRDAREAGCRRYDFYGIPPRDDPSHPMYGLYRFKTGFGGSIIHRIGSLDMPLNAPLYGLYRMAERARAFWFKKVVKLLRRETRRKS